MSRPRRLWRPEAASSGWLPDTPPTVLAATDLAATFFVAVEGARAGGLAGLDLFGVLVVAFASAIGGGVIRDLLIGFVPPAALRSVWYSVLSITGAAVVVILFQFTDAFPSSAIVALDAVALALFSVVGAAKALDHRIHPLMAVLLGTITAVGGGAIGDLLLGEVPGVLVAEVYATASIFGATVMVVAAMLGLPRTRAMMLGGVACFALRMTTLWFEVDLPRVVGA